MCLACGMRTTGCGQVKLVGRGPLFGIVSRDFVLDPAQPVLLIALSRPAITRTAALTALESGSRSWHVVCTSGTQSGIHAALAAGLGVAPHARSLVPPGLPELPFNQLPPLGDVEFVVLAGRSEEHTSELQSLMRTSYAVFCLKKKNTYSVQLRHTPLMTH